MHTGCPVHYSSEAPFPDPHCKCFFAPLRCNELGLTTHLRGGRQTSFYGGEWSGAGGLWAGWLRKAQNPHFPPWVNIPLDIMAIMGLLVLPLVWPWAKRRALQRWGGRQHALEGKGGPGPPQPWELLGSPQSFAIAPEVALMVTWALCPSKLPVNSNPQRHGLWSAKSSPEFLQIAAGLSSVHTVLPSIPDSVYLLWQMYSGTKLSSSSRC